MFVVDVACSGCRLGNCVEMMCDFIVRQTMQSKYGAGKPESMYIFTACGIYGVHFEAAGLNDVKAAKHVSSAEEMFTAV